MVTSIDVENRSGLGGLDAQASLPAHYELRARLGEGGFGVVYEVWDSKLRRSVAIKWFKHAGSRVRGGGLLHEARFAASLNHPAFVNVHAIEDDGASQFIVMELVRGSTLKEALASGTPEAATAIDWVAQIAEGMQHAHASGKVHGDLKPSNIMIEPGGKIRILDFGLALHHDMLTTTTLPHSEPQGTIAYMARERLLGNAPSAQGDIYALGVIFYELLCGTRPYASLNGLALVAAQTQSSSDSWPYPASITPPLIALVRDMTARTPGERLRSMDVVLQRLAALDKGGNGGNTVTPRHWRLPSGRARLLGGGALALAILGGGAWHYAPAIAAFDIRTVRYSEAMELERGLDALKLFDRQGSLERAVQHFKLVLEHNPDSAAAAAGIALAYSIRYEDDNKDPSWLQKADASAQQAVKLNEHLALSQIARGWVLNAQGQREAAIKAMDQALHVDPANFFAWFGKVRLLHRARLPAQALALLDEAIRRFPGERVFTDELGTLLYEKGDFPGAEKAFRQSIALQPDAVIAYSNLSACLLSQNRGEEALRVLQQGLQIRPNAKLYGNLGNALFQRGDYVGAAHAFENAVSPTHGAPGLYLNWANLADSLLWIPGREQEARLAYDKARKLLAPLLEQAPDDVLLVSRMGLYSARYGDKASALALVARAIALAPTSASVHFRAGLSYELLGQRQLALASIHQAMQLGYPAKFIETEPDLVALRRDRAYRPG